MAYTLKTWTRAGSITLEGIKTLDDLKYEVRKRIDLTPQTQRVEISGDEGLILNCPVDSLPHYGYTI